MRVGVTDAPVALAAPLRLGQQDAPSSPSECGVARGRAWIAPGPNVPPMEVRSVDMPSPEVAVEVAYALRVLLRDSGAGLLHHPNDHVPALLGTENRQLLEPVDGVAVRALHEREGCLDGWDLVVCDVRSGQLAQGVLAECC